jgi:hypothetical protein
MAEGGLFIGWGAPVPGQVRNTIGVFNEAVQFWMQKQQQGEIASFEVFVLEPHGGELAGFALIRGDQQKLNELRYDPEVLRLNNRVATVVQNVGVVSALPPEYVQTFYEKYQQDVSDLVT